MAASLDDPRAKLRRSRQHLDDLIDDYCRVFGLERKGDWATPHRDLRNDLVQKVVEDAEGRWVVFGQRLPELPEDWGLMLGDAIHNARAALDHLVCQLLILNGKRPTRRNGFPIYTERPQDARQRQRFKDYLKGLKPEHATGIRALQPYRLGNTREAWKLKTLSALDNKDKHELVHPVFGYETRKELERMGLERRIHVTPPPPGRVTVRIPEPTERIEGGVLELVRVLAPAPAHVKIEWSSSMAIGFGLADVTLLDTVEIHAYVVGIVESFAPDFG